jgi:hypothetical protein
MYFNIKALAMAFLCLSNALHFVSVCSVFISSFLLTNHRIDIMLMSSAHIIIHSHHSLIDWNIPSILYLTPFVSFFFSTFIFFGGKNFSHCFHECFCVCTRENDWRKIFRSERDKTWCNLNVIWWSILRILSIKKDLRWNFPNATKEKIIWCEEHNKNWIKNHEHWWNFFCWSCRWDWHYFLL